jgi:pyruvate dehydrogenase E1 component
VIKVLWGGGWDPSSAKDKSGQAAAMMEECVDGEYQDFKSKSGAYVREHFFGKYPELRQLVADLSDDDIWALHPRRPRLRRRSMPPTPRQSSTTGQPTVILAKTVKGYGMGESGEGQMISHQAKKMTHDALRGNSATDSRSRCQDEQIAKVPFIKLLRGQARRLTYLRERAPRWAATCRSGAASRRRSTIPPLSTFHRLLDNSGEREISDHDGLRADAGHAAARQEHRQARRADRAGRVAHLRHGGHVPPARHLFRRRPALQAAGCRPAHVLPRGQGRAGAAGGHQRGGAMSSWIAAATSYSTNNLPMIPFYIYYSMFGLQRVGDLAWAGG